MEWLDKGEEGKVQSLHSYGHAGAASPAPPYVICCPKRSSALSDYQSMADASRRVAHVTLLIPLLTVEQVASGHASTDGPRSVRELENFSLGSVWLPVPLGHISTSLSSPHY